MFSFIDTVLSFVFLALIILHLSWIAILLLPNKKNPGNAQPSLSVIIPAHNEEGAIEETIKSVFSSGYLGPLEVIVVNDGSTDATEERVRALMGKTRDLRVYRTDHVGKSNAINHGAKKSRNEVIVVLDGDSDISPGSLARIAAPFSDMEVGGVSGVVRAKLNINPLTWFQDFEYLQSSAWRHICNKVGATYIFPGFAAFRKTAYMKVGGFSPDTLSEDFEIGLKLRKNGQKLEMTNATIYTMVPQTIFGYIKQRVRWGRGTIQVLRKHQDMILNRKYGWVGLYGMPTQIYWFIHCIVYIPIFVYQIVEGYLRYFLNKDVIFSYDVAKYFFGWFSAYGIIEYAYKTLSGYYEVTLVFQLLLVMFMLYIVYNMILVLKFAKPHPIYAVVLFFFFPYALFSLVIHVVPAVGEIWGRNNTNAWEKSR